MNENRRKILDMLAAGHITADEAERLIAALDRGEAASSPANGSEPSVKAKPRYVRVLVEDAGRGTGPNVNIRVPMQLLRSGVKLTGLIPDHARAHVNQALREKGIPFDLNQIKPENLEEVIDQLADLTVDVADQDVKVKVFCE